MIALLLATAANCASSAATLLDANRLAMGTRPAKATANARYAYDGQGLKGWTSTTFDLATGRFVDEALTPPISDLHGFDGQSTWFRDLSGAFVPQGMNGRRAVAVSQAYVNAQAWWRKDRGGAQLQLVGCNAIKVTPPGGNSFEARFDPATKLLSSVRQTITFGISTETRFLDYQRRGPLIVPTRVETVTADDPSSRETMVLTSFKLTAAQPAVTYSMPVARPSDWSLPASGEATVPFRLINNHVIVDAKVNGKGPFPFLLDTGGHDIVTPSIVKMLQLTSQGETTSGGGGESLTTNGYARVGRIDVGGAVLENQTFVTLDFSPLSVEGIQLGGMIGLEFIERFVVRIDYGRRTITIMDRRKFGMVERQASGTAIPFTFYGHMPQIIGTFDGRPARFNIDTGSRSDVTMTSPFVARQGLRSAYPSGILATEGWGVGGPTRAYLVRAHSMKLGSIDVPGPIAGLSTASKGALSDSGYDGNVGSGVLKRFTVTFDYQRNLLYLKPTSHPDADTSQFDRSGMWLNLSNQGLAIMDVAPGGPAEAAGLKVGDVVTSIARQPVLQRSLSDIRNSLKTASVGQSLRIDYLRGGSVATTELTPRMLVP